MPGIRKRHSQHVKVKVVLEAFKGQLPTAEITSQYGVHASQIATWKKRALAILPTAFPQARTRSDLEQQALLDELYKQIGQLTVERDWLKKLLPASVAKKRLWLTREKPALSLRRQCHLLGLNWSSLYYQPKGESELNRLLMNALDEPYTRTPFYGVCNMTAHLRQGGYAVNEKRVRRLLRQMGLEVV